MHLKIDFQLLFYYAWHDYICQKANNVYVLYLRPFNELQFLKLRRIEQEAQHFG